MNGMPISVYCTQRDYEMVGNMFPYLTNPGKGTGSGYVPLLNWLIIDENMPFDVFGIQFNPLIVEHGHKFMSLGYRFGNIAYISDCSRISQKTIQKLNLSEEDRLDILIIDALSHCKEHPSHYWLPRSIDFVFKINPKESYFIGMEHSWDHDKTNDLLQNLFKTQCMRLPYDGLYIPINPLVMKMDTV